MIFVLEKGAHICYTKIDKDFGGKLMSITKRPFGKLLGGYEVSCYELDNHRGLRAEILDFGGIVKNLWVSDKSGEYVDVVLGYDTLSEYGDNPDYFGAIIGRNANRIQESKFKIDNKTYHLNANDGIHNLHGGLVGFDKKLWKAEMIDDPVEPALLLTLKSFDGEEGFPGDLDVMVTYTLTKENSLKIHYVAVPDKDTVVNLTNHSYFNLNGNNSEKAIYNHEMTLNCDFYTPNSAEGMGYGAVHSVFDTAFDFRIPKTLGTDMINPECEQIRMFEGYDHNFIINGTGYRTAGTLYSPDTGIYMECLTNSPCMQIYTGNGIKDSKTYKNNAHYGKHSAVCFETQFTPNSFVFPHIISPIIKKGEKFDYSTEYKFSIR